MNESTPIVTLFELKEVVDFLREPKLERATAVARQMVAIYGMSERLGLAHCARRHPIFLAGQEFRIQRHNMSSRY